MFHLHALNSRSGLKARVLTGVLTARTENDPQTIFSLTFSVNPRAERPVSIIECKKILAQAVKIRILGVNCVFCSSNPQFSIDFFGLHNCFHLAS
jgi:hypothetical protein